jgi:hypothetical protein
VCSGIGTVASFLVSGVTTRRGGIPPITIFRAFERYSAVKLSRHRLLVLRGTMAEIVPQIMRQRDIRILLDHVEIDIYRQSMLAPWVAINTGEPASGTGLSCSHMKGKLVEVGRKLTYPHASGWRKLPVFKIQGPQYCVIKSLFLLYRSSSSVVVPVRSDGIKVFLLYWGQFLEPIAAGIRPPIRSRLADVQKHACND